MKFSILVPVYNVEKYLEQCVDSLLNQTYKGEYEIILVDDGSTDSSGTICDRYAENNPDRIKVVHKENGGHTSARLEAIKNATGEYSLFCDSDDFVENNLLKTIDNVINQNPDTDMVIYSFCYYENGKKRQRKAFFSENGEIFEGRSKKSLYDLLVTTPYINSLCTKAIKTEIIKSTPINYNIIKGKDIAEDAYTVSCFVTMCSKIININDTLYNYRTNQKSISRSYNPQKIERNNILFLYNHFIDCLPSWGLDTEEYRQKLNARWLNETMYIFSKHYENVSIKDKKNVLNFDWESMLPEEAKINNNNPYESKINRKLYTCIVNKKFTYVNLYFLRKSIYKKYRKMKARLLNK